MVHAVRLWTLLSATFSCALATEVMLGRTKIIGLDSPQFKQEFFGGIPFASPPVGDLRFRPPIAKFTLDGPSLSATNFSASCVQAGLPFSEISENCLTLNVFRPAGVSSKSELPVMVFIYGGGFVAGQSSIMNGTGLVSRSIARGTPIVFVSLNYRLGPLGFPLGDEAARNGLLNLGLHDQLVALKWVHANIHAFGGDPKKVAVSDREFPFAPVLDGPGGLIPDYPTKRVARGAGGKLPFLSGTVLDEGTSFTPQTLVGVTQAEAFGISLFSPSPAGTSALQTAVQNTLAQYSDDPADGCPYFTGNDTFGLDPEYKRTAAFVTDIGFLSLRRWFGRAAAARGALVHSYMFTDPQPENPPQIGITHASELPYVFGGTPAGNPGAPQLSEQMMDYWISFATSLDPNDGKGSERPKWEPYTPSKEFNHANLTMIADEFHISQTEFNDKNHFRLAIIALCVVPRW
ncbi:hypothetical protein EWM64_g5204 [Hericium alpestre]|uniref:Carboxylesterase type B domain-containing protein n=1 Tax=Hericium alpestre TaxID=135208 RepID=A0A4Y9ZZE3_9AGAM|nr:hypothetical protein EWM64_g5204 [Hericium alpestre]